MGSISNRPVYLNLLRIKQPVTAVVSILHRITGVILSLLLPAFVYLLSLSLGSEAGFAQAAHWLGSATGKLCLLLLAWVLAHHLFAGIRFLLLDFDVGLTRPLVRRTAWLVHGLALVSAVLIGGWLF